jgi:lactate dehydrogenase-like 2-hydroxyacid dehydrogenase
MSAKIGFVGVGRIGANMARHLKLDCNYNVSAIYDIDRVMTTEGLGELDKSGIAELTFPVRHSK